MNHFARKNTCLALALALSPALWAQSVTGFPSVPLKDRRPAIGADYPGLRLRPETERMVLDGRDVTNLCAIGGARMSLEPGWDLNYGGHRVQFSATTESGQRVENSWNFSIQPPQQKPLSSIWNSSSIPNLSLQQKFPQNMVSSTRPEVGARFMGQFQSVRLLVDGQDQTNASNRTANSIIWQPRYNIDPGTHTVMVDATGIHGHRVVDSWNFQVPGNNNGFQGNPPPLEITRYWPQPGGYQSPRSKLGADFNENLSSVRLFADGQELTSQSSISGNGIRWVPQSDLSQGNHNLRVVARSLSGQQLIKDWSFQVAGRQQPYQPAYVPPHPGWTPGGTLATFPNGPCGPRAPIGVTLPSGTNYDYFQLMLDGRDITAYSHRDRGTFYFVPDYNLQQGLHQVNFSAWNRGGASVDQSWNVMVQ